MATKQTQDTSKTFKKIENLILDNKDEKALELAKETWKTLVKNSSLDIDSAKILVIIGTVLHRKGNNREAFGYLHRFHYAYSQNPTEIYDGSELLDWGELLHVALAESVRIELQDEVKNKASAAVSLDIEWQKLAYAQFPQKKAPIHNTDTQKRSKSQPATGSTGCIMLLFAVMLVCIGIFFIL